MNTVSSPPKQRIAVSHLLAGVIGGLLVLVVGSILIATDVIDTGNSTTIVRQAPLSQPASDTGATKGGRTVQDIYAHEGKGVVYIQSEGVGGGTDLFGQQQQGTATGSGFVVDKNGTIVTNAHVVDGASKVTVSLEEGGDQIDAKVEGVDNDSDVAVLKIDPSGKDLTVLPLGDSSKAQVGDPVVAIGNPFGLQRTVTTGIVSALQRQVNAPSGFAISNVIQTDAAINPGNSGGPLINAQGQVIGINSQIQTGGGQGSVGIGFAVPINTVKQLLPKLEAGQTVHHGYLGVVVGDLTSDQADHLKVPTSDGALVGRVENGGPADDAGLKKGDVIVAIDGKKISGQADVISTIAAKSAGDTVKVEYYRGSAKHTAEVKLGERPKQLSQASDQSPNDNGLPFNLP
jgi:S1-C subfamily serine protease